MAEVGQFRIFLEDVLLSPETNSLTHDMMTQVVEVQTFDTGSFKARIPTTAAMKGAVRGWANMAASDATLNAPATNSRITIARQASPAVGDVAYTFKSTLSSYTVGGEVNGAVLLSADFESSDQATMRARNLHYGITTATANGTGYDLGTPPTAAQTLYCILHVEKATVGGTSPTLDVVWERDIDITFGTPTTLGTFSTATDAANTFQILTVAGAQTEQFHRLTWTVGGTGSPTFKWMGIVGIATTP